LIREVGLAAGEIREVHFEKGCTRWAEGSALARTYLSSEQVNISLTQ